MSDEVINCSDCRTEFTFTASEASFYASKGLTKPRRCKPCRQKRKAANAGGSEATPQRPSVQWISGNEDTRQNRKKDRRRDRGSDDYGA